MIYDTERMALWVQASERWLHAKDQFIGLDIQMLGHAEAPLLGFEGVLAELLKGGDHNENTGLFCSQCFALSTYWIFGLYEALRKMKQNLKGEFVDLEPLYHDVSVIRMPLAKHEVKGSPGYREKWHYPTSIFQPLTGKVGWQVFDPKIERMTEIYRKDIADRFLSVDGYI